MILAVFFAQIHPSYLTQQWHRLRSIIFCSVSGYGIIPTIHWIWLNGGIGASIVQVKEKKEKIRYPFAFLLLSSFSLLYALGNEGELKLLKLRIISDETIQLQTLRN